MGNATIIMKKGIPVSKPVPPRADILKTHTWDTEAVFLSRKVTGTI
jgi:hypothetical protein